MADTSEDVENPELAALIPPAPTPRGKKVYTFRAPAEGGVAADSQLSGQIAVGDQSGIPILGATQTTAAPAQTPPPAGAPAPEDRENPELAALIPRAEKKEESRLSKLIERIHPTKTEAEGGVIDPDLDKTPDWTGAIPWSHPDQAARMVFGMGIATPEEAFDIFKEQLPDAKIERAGKFGQYIKIKPAGDDQTYTWKPGMRPSDFARAAVTAPIYAGGAALSAAMLPAAAPAILPALGGAALVELQKYNAGGGFNPSNLAGAAAGHVAMDLAGPALRATGRALNATGAAMHGVAPDAAGALAGAEGSAVQPGAAALAPAVAAEPGSPPPLTAQQLGPQMAKAARGNAAAQSVVDSQVMPNQQAVAAAQQLKTSTGEPLLDALAPAHVSRNPVYQKLSNAMSGAKDADALAAQTMGDVLTHAADLAGAPKSQGALETQAKNAISRKLEALERLMKESYGNLNGAEEIAATESAARQPAIKGLIPKKTRTPVPEFIRKVAELKEDLGKEGGALTKPAENFIKELFSGGEIPTRDMVDTMRKRAGEDIGKGGGKLGLKFARAFDKALDADYTQGAREFTGAVAEGPLAGMTSAQLLERADNAFKTLRDARALTRSILGERAENSITDKIAQELGNLPHGTADEFHRAMGVVPNDMKAPIATIAFRRLVDEAGSLKLREFNTLMRGMAGNDASWNALKRYIPNEFADNIKALGHVSENVESAMRAIKPRDFKGTFTDPIGLWGVAKRTLQIAALGKAPIPGEAKYALADRLIAPRTPTNEAINDYLASPLARHILTAEAQGSVSPGLVKATLSDSRFRRMANHLQLSTWVRNALVTGSNGQQEAGK